PDGWLPEAEWTPLKVHRKELGVKTQAASATGRVERIYLDYYFVLSNRNDCAHVQSMTIRNDHVTFRADAERMIKSMEFLSAKSGDPPTGPPATSGPRSAPPPIR